MTRPLVAICCMLAVRAPSSSAAAAAETTDAQPEAATPASSEAPTPLLQPLEAMLDGLERAAACGSKVDATPQLAFTFATVHPSLIPLARRIARTPNEIGTIKDMDPKQLSVGPIASQNNETYFLENICRNDTIHYPIPLWQGRFEFPFPNRGKDGLILRPTWLIQELDLCEMAQCETRCSVSVHSGLRIYAKECCPDDPIAICRNVGDRGRHMLILFNVLFASICVALIPLSNFSLRVLVRRFSPHHRARRSQHENRGWALMEIFLLGAIVLYSILLLDWMPFPQHEWSCGLAVCLRQIGFSMFYGSIILKIYRNLEEYRVRKAQHVSVREEDMLKYLACIMTITVTGMFAWIAGSAGNKALWRTSWPQCTIHAWGIISHFYELAFLLYGGILCYKVEYLTIYRKARNSDWLERWQFTVAVCLEFVVTLVANLIRYSIRYSGNSDTLFTVTFVQLQLTVSVNLVIIIAPKFYVTGDNSRRSLALGGQTGRAHPSLAKLRDNILNGTLDFAEVPIHDMNPEDIRAELKRVYTQLRMYKLKNLYQDNPHISKRKGGGKRWSDKPKPPRRISVPNSSPQATKIKIEEDEKSDLTVESAPHNVLLSTTCQFQLEPNSSVRV
ncbi:hypothetical protein PRIPAC_84083 [Pristionchus pacificus]|uniref:G_PROTEIN_RECEP_F3_4 domain-containing protein n=1 Tax=Pristionchus pacificus TaxID=54126 RepID=A0A2A6BL57_PRIPA|nr:hypothetical protein PRIPAC_84083 [Pristionchus pacificus]|eukprot:PDM66662.1 hypothetical protein PRIPAC_48079 [Pristionchus pacificus]